MLPFFSAIDGGPVYGPAIDPRTLDQVDRMAKGLSEQGILYVVAISWAVSAFLFTTVLVQFWRAGRREATWLKQAIEREERHNREQDKVRREHIEVLVSLQLTARGLVDLKEELKNRLLKTVEAEKAAQEATDEAKKAARRNRGGTNPAIPIPTDPKPGTGQ